MTDEAQKTERSESADETVIGWRVQGQVSGQDQRSINVSAALNFNLLSPKEDTPTETTRGNTVAEVANHRDDLQAQPTPDPKPNCDFGDISLARALGQSAEDVRDISDLLWNEMCVSKDTGISALDASIRARISNEIDPSWAQSLLYEAEDQVSPNRDILISRPIVSDESGVLSLVLSETMETMTSNKRIAATDADPTDCNGRQKWPRIHERRTTTDIGFCTIEVKLLPHDDAEFNDESALSLLDPRRNSPVGEESLGVSFNIMSLYLHPDYRKRGLGHLLASFAKTFIIYVVDELVDQVSYREYVRRAQSRESNSSRSSLTRHPSRGGALDIVVCGTSVDHRSDHIFRTILGGVLGEYGGDWLSSASPTTSVEASRLRSFALVCNKIMAANSSHRESAVLANILRSLGDMHSFHPCQERSSPWGKVTTTTVDLVDWRADR